MSMKKLMIAIFLLSCSMCWAQRWAADSAKRHDVEHAMLINVKPYINAKIAYVLCNQRGYAHGCCGHGMSVSFAGVSMNANEGLQIINTQQQNILVSKYAFNNLFSVESALLWGFTR
jgi:hypothetical protein